MPITWNRAAFRVGGTGTQPLRVPWWVVFLPILFLTLALMSTGFVWYAPYMRVPVPMRCVPVQNLTRCHPEDVVISIMSGAYAYDNRATAMNVTWVPHARWLGMTVNFFGEVPESTIPVIGLAPENATRAEIREYAAMSDRGSYKRMFAMWEWTLKHHPHKKWFFKCEDTVFMHPYEFLRKSVCGMNPKKAQVIGKFSEKMMGDLAHLWTPANAGYLLSRPALKKLLRLYRTGKCVDRHDEDVTVLSCLHEYGVRVHGHKDYNDHAPDRKVFWEARNWTLYTTYNGVEEDDCWELADASFHHCHQYPRFSPEGVLIADPVYRKSDTKPARHRRSVYVDGKGSEG